MKRVRFMSNPSHVMKAIVARLGYEVQREHEILSEMDKIVNHYHWYCDLMKQQAESDARARRIGRLLKGSAGVVDPSNLPDEALQKLEDIKKTESDLPLWEAMAEYLTHVKEATIEDIQEFFNWLPKGQPSRPAIESALKTHKDLFKIAKKANGKFVSMKDKTK